MSQTLDRMVSFPDDGDGASIGIPKSLLADQHNPIGEDDGYAKAKIQKALTIRPIRKSHREARL